MACSRTCKLRPGVPRGPLRRSLSGSPIPAIALALCAGWAALPGCEPSAGRGVTTLEAVPVLSATETLRVGSVEDPDLGFSQVSGVDVDRDGNLFVAEGLEREIRVYAPDGTFLRRIGRKGEGPGEFQFLRLMGVIGDTVWVVDNRLQRTTLFRRDGTILSTGSWTGLSVPEGPGRTLMIGPLVMRSDGLFSSQLAGVAMSLGATAAPDSTRIPRVRFEASGAVLDTVGWDVVPVRTTTPVQVGSRRYTVPSEPGDVPLRLPFAGGEWVVQRPRARADTTSRIRITRLDLAGDTVVAREYRYEPRRYPDQLLDSLALQSYSRSAFQGAPQADAVRRAVRDAMDFHEFQPPILEGIVGSDGTLWLRREQMGGSSDRWLIIGSEGRPRGYLEVLRRSRVAWVGEGSLVLVERDALDVPWVVRYQLGS